MRSHAARAMERLPVAPAWLGLAAVPLLIGAFIAGAWLSGELASFRSTGVPWFRDRGARLGVVIALLAAYLPVARGYARAFAAESLRALRAEVGAPSKVSPAGSFDRPVRRAASACGLLCVPLVALLIDRDPSLYLMRDYWSSTTVWTWSLGLFLGWQLGAFAWEVVAGSRAVGRLAEELPPPDLFDLAALAPCARQGVRSGLLCVIFVSIFALNFGDRGFLWVAALLVPAAALLIGLAVWIPVRGARRRIRESKRAELAQIHRALRGDATAAGRLRVGGRADPRGLQDLLAYRSFVISVREWPFDASSAARVALYLLIPLGSWLGGALIEQALAVLLRGG